MIWLIPLALVVLLLAGTVALILRERGAAARMVAGECYCTRTFLCNVCRSRLRA